MEIRKGQGVLGKTALSFFYLGTEQSRGRGGGALAGGPGGHGGGRRRGKRGRGYGDSIPGPTSGRDGARRRDDEGWWQVEVAAAAAL